MPGENIVTATDALKSTLAKVAQDFVVRIDPAVNVQLFTDLKVVMDSICAAINEVTDGILPPVKYNSVSTVQDGTQKFYFLFRPTSIDTHTLAIIVAFVYEPKCGDNDGYFTTETILAGVYPHDADFVDHNNIDVIGDYMLDPIVTRSLPNIASIDSITNCINNITLKHHNLVERMYQEVQLVVK